MFNNKYAHFVAKYILHDARTHYIISQQSQCNNHFHNTKIHNSLLKVLSFLVFISYEKMSKRYFMFSGLLTPDPQNISN